MPPHTTYVRITPHSVLQLRIFTEQPLDAGPRWLMHPTEPALPKIIDAIKHLIIPKLREENRAKHGAKASGSAGRGAKAKKKIKDVVVTDDFEISLWLKEVQTRHNLLVKQKEFREGKGKLKGNSTKMTEAAGGRGEQEDAVVILEEEEESSEENIENIPQHRPGLVAESQDNEVEILESDAESEIAGNDDKKKLSFKTSYDGFSIWGWTLMLYVRRKDSKKGGPSVPSGVTIGLSDKTSSLKNKESSLMEEWISTQAIGETTLDEEDVGD